MLIVGAGLVARMCVENKAIVVVQVVLVRLLNLA